MRSLLFESTKIPIVNQTRTCRVDGYKVYAVDFQGADPSNALIEVVLSTEYSMSQDEGDLGQKAKVKGGSSFS